MYVTVSQKSDNCSQTPACFLLPLPTAWLTSAFSDWLKASGGRIRRLTDISASTQAARYCPGCAASEGICPTKALSTEAIAMREKKLTRRGQPRLAQVSISVLKKR